MSVPCMLQEVATASAFISGWLEIPTLEAAQTYTEAERLADHSKQAMGGLEKSRRENDSDER